MASALTTTIADSLPVARGQINNERPAEVDVDTRPLAVSARGLVKRYSDGTEANRGIDLDVRRGEVVSILGPNGAGKTTFLRQLTTELRPTSGSIKVLDVDVIKEPLRAKRVMGITPQEAGQRSDATHLTFVDFAAVRGLCDVLGLRVVTQRSFPLPRPVGRVFKHNEFVTVARAG